MCYYSLERLGLHPLTSKVTGLILGIFYAYWMNVHFNFKVPESKRRKAFCFFVIISIGSAIVQYTAGSYLGILDWEYINARFTISGCLFLIVYVLHRRFSFVDYRKVGVAIYTTHHEDIKGIYEKVDVYPDFIHVDVVDDTFVENAETPTIHRLEVIKAYWPKKHIHIHLMSKKPLRWVPDLIPFADLLFIQVDIKDDVTEILSLIRKSGKKSGLCISMETPLEKLKAYLSNINAVMILAVPKAGYSGQRFDMNALDRIEEIRSWQKKWDFDLCIDGGVNEQNIGLLNAEYVVSGSCVLENTQPHRQIMRLQTQSSYEIANDFLIQIDIADVGHPVNNSIDLNKEYQCNCNVSEHQESNTSEKKQQTPSSISLSNTSKV
jgi:ribulose-phosphate 3-epimerase